MKEPISLFESKRWLGDLYECRESGQQDFARNVKYDAKWNSDKSPSFKEIGNTITYMYE